MEHTDVLLPVPYLKQSQKERKPCTVFQRKRTNGVFPEDTISSAGQGRSVVCMHLSEVYRIQEGHLVQYIENILTVLHVFQDALLVPFII